MCWTPFWKRHPGQASHRACDAYGQSNRFERIGSGTFTSIPPSASIRSLKSAKLITITWSISSPVNWRIVRIASAGPPIWNAALIFCVPAPGIGTWMSRGIER